MSVIARAIATGSLGLKGEGKHSHEGECDDENDVESEGREWWRER